MSLTFDPNTLTQTDLRVLLVTLTQALIRKGVINKEDLMVEMMQLEVPADIAFNLQQMLVVMPNSEKSEN